MSLLDKFALFDPDEGPDFHKHLAKGRSRNPELAAKADELHKQIIKMRAEWWTARGMYAFSRLKVEGILDKIEDEQAIIEEKQQELRVLNRRLALMGSTPD
jgi:hypothetical protein